MNSLTRFFIISFPLYVALSATSFSSTPLVLSVSPSPNIANADPFAPIVITFDSSMDTTSFTGSTVMVFGHWSGVLSGEFQFENNNTRMRYIHQRPLSAGELVTVSVSKGVKDQNGDSLAHGYAWTFWVRTLPGTLDLTAVDTILIRRIGEGWIQTYGAYGGDLNRDGYLDITVVNERSNDARVFLADSLGNYSAFTVYPIPGGSRPSPNEGTDLNGDGIIDYAVGNSANDSVSVFIGDGLGGFLPVRNYHAANAVRGVAILDFDGDGKMDISTANRNGDNVSLFHGNGDGTFAQRVNIEANGTQETAIVAADANGDGILDLFVAALSSSEMIVLLGDGDGGFTFSHKVSTGSGPWMIAVGDVNGDGNVDVVSANSNGNSASVIFGDGEGGLLPATNYPVGNFPLAIDLGDLDGDGDLDMVVSSYGTGDWSVYENNGSGLFINRRILPASIAGSCATLYDHDNDGDLDFTGIDEIADLIFIFDNQEVTSTGTAAVIPTEYKLHQSYPNPFNPTAVITYEIPEAGNVSLIVYDVLGREVTTLVDGVKLAGEYSVTWKMEGLVTGVYFYRLKAGDFVDTKKLVLLR